jgi:hypothetical protein
VDADRSGGEAVVTRARRPAQRGFTVLETVTGLAVTTIVVALAFDGGRLPAIAATRSLDRLQASRACASALERLDRAALAVGERDLDPTMPGARGTLVLKEISPLLFEATSTLVLKDGTAVSATTRLVKEGGR